MKVFCLAGMVLFLSACAASRYPANRMHDPISVAQFYCSNNKNSQLNNQLDSESLYSEMRMCLIKENYTSAVFLFSLAGSRSWYDATSSGNEDLKDRHATLLKKYLEGIPSANVSQFWAKLHETLGIRNRLVETCDKLATFEMEIKRQSKSNTLLTWKDALGRYLHCPFPGHS